MTHPDQWKEIDRIFAAALEHKPAEREAFLNEVCAGNQQLRKEVESLLAHDLQETLAGADAVVQATRLMAKVPDENSLSSVGRFKVIRSLGSGGMGHVYLARDEQLNRPVAIKMLVISHEIEEDAIRRFQQEALAASALNHPNILTIYEIGEAAGRNFIATEFVDGITLLERIEAGPLTIEDSLKITLQMASALAAAHSAGIIHRDIKPANVMIRSDGLVKILDFGIAKYEAGNEQDAKKALVETVPGSVMGTASYMSPEQTRGLNVDARTDIWSLGVVLYEMLTGRRPFIGDTAVDVMSAVIEQLQAPFSTYGLRVPAALELIVSKALQKDRAVRYQSANEMLADLAAFTKWFESGSKNETIEPTTPVLSTATDPEDTIGSQTNKVDRRSRTSRKYVPAIVALCLLLLAAAGFAYWSYTSRHRPIESIAVLPFKNDSGNDDVEYLSDGMADSLINSLSQLPNLSVKARSSVFRYKGQEVDPQSVASSLSVQTILTGRVVQHGNDLTLYLALVDRDGNQLWGTQYDRKLADLVSLQREIALDVLRNVRVRLSGTDEQKLTKDYTANVEAYQLYLRGRFHSFKLTPAEAQLGIADFQQAIQIDPNYALAYVGLSDVNRTLALGAEMPPNEVLPKAKAAAQKALEIDEALAEAHTAYGATLFWYERDWAGAENHYKRAVELNPNSADAHMFYAHLCSNTGRHAEALAEIKKAREIDPVSPFVSTLEGQFLLYAGKKDEALARLQETFLLAPNFWFPHLFASSVYIEKGMYAEAINEARRATELSPSQTVSIAFESYALEKAGRPAEARAKLDELLKLSNTRYVPPCHIAMVYNGLGETDQALAWLQRGIVERDPKIAFLKVEPKWNNLRSDPRFQQLLQRAGFNP